MQNSLVIPKGLARIVAFLSQLKPSNILAGLIIFFSATQLGLHFWPLSSLVYGVRIDYLAPTIYFLDILIILYFALQFRSLRDSRRAIETFIPILLVNLLYSQNPLSTLSWSLHFFLYFVFLRRLLDRRPEQRSSRDAEGGRSLLVGTITLSLIFQTLLAASQVFLGHSVGGLLYYLGERNVAVGSPNIALTTFIDRVILRAHGTFSHPNILAGFAVTSLLIIIQFRTQRNKFEHLRIWDLRLMFPLSLTTLLILLTQSRAAALALFGFVIPIHFFKSIRTRLVYFAILLIPLSYFLFTPPRSDLSASQRLNLQGLSLKVIQSNPTFGTGTQASISTYPTVSPPTRLLQPDHNSFTLFLSWFGLFGVLAILYSLRSHLIPSSYFLIPILPLLLLDHYLLTSPQGLFILLLYFNVVNYSHAQKDRQ